jgi:hypothetical protein
MAFPIDRTTLTLLHMNNKLGRAALGSALERAMNGWAGTNSKLQSHGDCLYLHALRTRPTPAFAATDDPATVKTESLYRMHPSDLQQVRAKAGRCALYTGRH